MNIIKEAMAHTEVSSPGQLRHFITELHKTFGNHPPVIGYKLRKLHQQQKYKTCTSILKEIMGVKCRVKLICYSASKYEEKFGTDSVAQLFHPYNYPALNSTAFSKLTVEIHFKDEFKKDYGGFVKTITHELAHVVLFSNKHYLKYSEVSTDLLPFVFGFGEIIINSPKNGYLGREYSLQALQFIKSLRPKIYFLHDFISVRFNKRIG